MKASGVDLANHGVFQELRQFQQHLSDYKIIVFDGLNPNRVMFSGNSLSTKKLHLLYEHYNVITNLKGAWRNSTFVTGVILYITIRTNVTKFVPCVLLHHPVLRIRPNIVVHVSGGFPVRSVFRII